MSLDGWPIVKCVECGFCYSNPRLKKAILESAYDDANEYADQVHGVPNHELYEEIGDIRTGLFERHLVIIESFTPKGRILDLGCGTGTFLKVAKGRGWRPYGLEIGNWARAAAERIGFHITIATLKEAQFPSEYFDVVYSHTVVEHLDDPLSELREIYRVLKNGGVMVACGIPNFGSLPIRLGKDDFLSNRPPGHLNYFKRNTLKMIVEKSGFKVLKLASVSMSRRNSHLLGRVSAKVDRYESQTPQWHILRNLANMPISPFNMAKRLGKIAIDRCGIGVSLEIYAQKRD